MSLNRLPMPTVVRFPVMEPKIIIENSVLRKSLSGDMQLIAIIYRHTQENRVYAPPKAVGDPAEWKDQLHVRQYNDSCNYEVKGAERNELIELALAELKKQKRKAIQPKDDLYSTAQICLHGDVQRSDGLPLPRSVSEI